jgi:hypothetical protein
VPGGLELGVAGVTAATTLAELEAAGHRLGAALRHAPARNT